jgi:hypothetical protein
VWQACFATVTHKRFSTSDRDVLIFVVFKVYNRELEEKTQEAKRFVLEKM